MNHSKNPTQREEQEQQNARRAFLKQLAPYRKSSTPRALIQLFNTFIPYLLIWGVLVFIIKSGYHYGFAVPFLFLGGLFLIRIFIIFHDCCHGSFFASNKANKVLGYITGILTFTPYYNWRYTHNMHHATAGDLDRRGIGDVWTLTVDEYRKAPWTTRLWYRIFRNPLIMLGFGPFYSFFILNRFTEKNGGKRAQFSVRLTNLTLLAILIAAGFTIGLSTYLVIQVPIMLVGGAIGVWLFYIQHQFEDVYWARHEAWYPVKASLEGSSYYKLPRLLQWITGNIGFHHVHHMDPRIPNYNLERCYREVSVFQTIQPLTIRKSLESFWKHLWDEQNQKLVGFSAARR